MKQQILLPFASLLIIMSLFISCENVGPVAQINETQHTHQDTLEEVVDNLLITSRQFKAAGLELGQLKETNITGNIKVSGRLEVPPQSRAEISTYVGGIIKSILVSPGSYVKKNQAVMTLEHPDFLKLQEEYIDAKESLNLLEKDFQRKEKLLESSATSSKKLQESESKYKIGKKRLISLTNQLSILGISIAELNKGNFTRALTLRSPIKGYITAIQGNLGAYAEPNKKLLEVTDNSNILVCLDVYERDFYKIKKGQKITIVLPNQDNVQIEGKIITLGKAMDDRTKSIPVYAEIKDNKLEELIPGIFVNAFLYVNDRTALVATSETVVRSGAKQYVFIVNEDLCSKPNIPGEDPHTIINSAGETIPLAYKMIEIKTGTEEEDLVEINPTEPISSLDKVVVKGAYFLMSALKSGETVGCCAPAEE